jgi:hypothetical protein
MWNIAFTVLKSYNNSYSIELLYTGVSQPPGCGPVPGPGINYTGPREFLLEFVILIF